MARQGVEHAALPDDTLMALQAGGDGAAAAELAGRHTRRVLAVAQRMLGGDLAEAEDVAQEAMLRLWRTAPDWQPGRARVSTWLYRVAANLCTDRLRRRRQVALDAVAEPMDETPGVEARLMADDRMSALQAALDTLPERQRLAVVLRHIEGASNPEIAEALDTSVEAVESLTARGRRALTALLAPARNDVGLEE